VELLVLDGFRLRFGLRSCFEGERVILDQVLGDGELGLRCVEIPDLNWPLEIGQRIKGDPSARELLPESFVLTSYSLKL